MPTLALPRISGRGVIHDTSAQPTNRRVAFFTALARLPSSDTWLSAFQIGSAKHAVDSTIQICRSTDSGQTWTALNPALATCLDGIHGSLSAPALVETAPGRVLLFATWFDRSEPGRPLFDPVTQGILRSRQLVAESSDQGQSWTPWRVLPTPDLAGCSGTGPVLHWPDGTLAYAFESFKTFDDTSPGRHAARLMISRDGGQTFGPPAIVAADPDHQVYYWDQRLCTTGRPGEFAALFWTHDLAQQRDLTVHVRRGRLDGNNLSLDPIRPTPIRGQIAAPHCLPDGRWLAFVVDRAGPCTLALWQSRDEGQTWPESSRLVIHTHEERAQVARGGEVIDFNQYWEDMGKWSFGHPAIERLNDRQVLCAYYAGSPECMSIHWARVDL